MRFHLTLHIISNQFPSMFYSRSAAVLSLEVSFFVFLSQLEPIWLAEKMWSMFATDKWLIFDYMKYYLMWRVLIPQKPFLYFVFKGTVRKTA